MKVFSKNDLNKFDRIKKLNLINSLSGIKPGNLIGTKSINGHENLAIFSSVVHLGSNPPLLGFIMRPSEEVRRDTYENIKETGYYTINHIPLGMTKQAHHTSAKFDKGISEFEACGFTSQSIDGFSAPFVEESNIKMGLKFVEAISINANNTQMIIGEIEMVLLDENVISEEGYLNLEKANSAGLSGLNSYYSFKKIDDYPYARTQEVSSL